NAGHPLGGSPVGSQVGYWDFNEGSGTVANDKSAGKNNGTINGASWSNDAKSGKALSFNGSSNNISLGNITAYKTENKTISFWAKPSSAPSAFQGIFYGGLNYYVGVHSSNRIFISYGNSSNAQQTAASP